MLTKIFALLVSAFGRKPEPAPAAAPPVLPPPPASRFMACLAEILKHEGGYVDHPDDPGGATNLGITHKTLASWRGRPVTKQDVRDLTVTEASAIYRARYWNPVRGDSLPPGVDLAVFDFAVNSGPAKATMVLQSVLGVADDGVIGPITLAALARAPGPATVIIGVCDARLAFLRRLSTWPTFGRGWTRRVSEVSAAGLKAAAP